MNLTPWFALAGPVSIEHVITTGGVVVVALISAVSAVQVAMIQSGRRWAKRAAERSEPTGNGYAKRTEEALERIEASQRELRRDVGGIRHELRATNDRVDHVARRFDHHLEQRKNS